MIDRYIPQNEGVAPSFFHGAKDIILMHGAIDGLIQKMYLKVT